jgi:proteasome lid subunit RPN8/RPN11
VVEEAPSSADLPSAAREAVGSRRLAGVRPSLASVPAALSARISADLLQELIDWARAAAPNESCGLLIAPRHAEDGGEPTRFVGLRNVSETPRTRYEIDPQEQADVMLPADDAGDVVWAIFHSHPATDAVPSQTDVGQAYYPESLYLLCSLADPIAPTVRGWMIRDGGATEVPLEVVIGE